MLSLLMKKIVMGRTSISFFLLKSPWYLGTASAVLHTKSSCKETKERVKQLCNGALRQRSSERGHEFSHLMRILISFFNKLALCQEESKIRHNPPLGHMDWPGNEVEYKKHYMYAKMNAEICPKFLPELKKNIKKIKKQNQTQPPKLLSIPAWPRMALSIPVGWKLCTAIAVFPWLHICPHKEN